MDLTTILQVAISLIFVWLILSIAVMYLQDWLGTQLRWRSQMLETFIGNMLTDPALADQFYSHPLIKSLHSGEEGNRRPSKISSQMFTMTLFDLVINAGKKPSILHQEVYKLRSTIDQLQKNDKARADAQFELVLLAARKALNTQAGEEALDNAMAGVKLELDNLAKINPLLQTAVQQTLSNVKVTTQDIDSLLQTVGDARKQSSGDSAADTPPTTMDQLRDGLAVMAVTNPQLKQALDSLFLGVDQYGTKGEQALAQGRQNIEKWFDNGMDRLGGWFKRSAQNVSIILGISIAIFVNADTVMIAQTLMKDPVLRNALVAQAESFSKKSPDQITSPELGELKNIQTELTNMNMPIGWVGAPLSLSDTPFVPQDGSTPQVCTMWPVNESSFYGLPMGNKCYPLINTPAPNDLTGIILKVFGLLASGLAAAQGAPFWFDILKKAVNMGGGNAQAQPAKSA